MGNRECVNNKPKLVRCPDCNKFMSAGGKSDDGSLVFYHHCLSNKLVKSTFTPIPVSTARSFGTHWRRSHDIKYLTRKSVAVPETKYRFDGAVSVCQEIQDAVSPIVAKWAGASSAPSVVKSMMITRDEGGTSVDIKIMCYLG